jgi:predicted ATPase/DNA-binding CsgD family transcriptional regulator
VARTGPPRHSLLAGGDRCRWNSYVRAQNGGAEALDASRRAGRLAPLSLTRSFGREQATAELMDVVERARLVTLVGAPGCGKTRLGLEVGARLADRLPARVVVVELGSIRDPSLVPSAVAAAVGGDGPPCRPVDDVGVETPAIDDILIVLDTCEHLRDAVRDLVVRLLDGCPSLHMLATSRCVLGVPGEHVWRVPPLDLGPAVDLFRDRAVVRAPDGSIEATKAETVEQICRRLDCLPLAIEQVAAWSRVLTPTEILDRLDSAGPLPQSQFRDADARRPTMDDAVTWSYQLLEPADQLLFEQLSTFAHGFDLEAAQAIATRDDVLDGLASLVDHSLVVAEPTSAGAMRYRILEPVRRCAESRLAADGRLDASRRRHAEHYLEVALRSNAELRGRNPATVVDRLKDDDANFRAALAWCRRQADDLGLRLSTALATSWALRGCVDEGRAWIEDMLHLRAATEDRRLRASALARASCLAWRQHDYPSTRALLDESLAIERELNDASGVARRLRSMAALAMVQGDLAEAEQLCEQSVATFRSNGDDYGLSLALAVQGMTLQLGGDARRAERSVQEALDVNRGRGNTAVAVYGFGTLAIAALAAGDMAGLRAHAITIAEVLRAAGASYEDLGWWWSMVAALASGEGRYHTALLLAGAADATVQRNGPHLLEQLRPQTRPWLERARARIGPIRARELTAQGARSTPDELLDAALCETDHDSTMPLSPRELEIAELVAAGLTNQEIAQRLIISTRTVESHVSHIKSKLGFSRRARIVAWALGREPR